MVSLLDADATAPTTATTVAARRGSYCPAGASAKHHKHPGLRLAAVTSPVLIGSVEQELGLPSGAWWRRRLFALRVTGPGLEELAIRRGDLLIVEPGQQANCDHLVIVRQGSTLLLRRVSTPAGNARPSVLIPPEPGALPFPLSAAPLDVIGTVIGVYVKSFSAVRLSPATPARPPASVLRALNAQRLDANLAQWRNWTEASQPASGSLHHRYRKMLGERLRILASCMAVAANRRLYGALLDEASRVITAMQQEAGCHHGPVVMTLVPIFSHGLAAARHQYPSNPQYAHTDECRSA